MKTKILALMMAAMMILTLAACGGGNNGGAGNGGGNTVSESGDNDVEGTGNDGAAEGSIDVSNWTCYMGVMDDASTIYYAFDETGARGAIIVLSSDYTQSVSVIGDVGYYEDSGYYSVTDDNTGLMLTFGAYDTGDGGWEIDFGPQGTAVVAESDPQEVLNAMDTIAAGTTDVTEDFIASLG